MRSIKKLLTSTRDDESLAVEAFQRLIGYSCFHFEDEEALMAQEGLDPRFSRLPSRPA